MNPKRARCALASVSLAVFLSLVTAPAFAESASTSSLSVRRTLAPHFSLALVDPSDMSQITWPSWGKKDLLSPAPRPVPNAPAPAVPAPAVPAYAAEPVFDTAPAMPQQPLPGVEQAPLDNAVLPAPQPKSYTDKIENDVAAWGTRNFSNPDDKARHDPALPRTANDVGGPMAYNAKENPAPQDIYAKPYPREELGANPSFSKRAENWLDNLFGMPGDNLEGRKDMPRTRAATGTPGTYSPRSTSSVR